MESQDNKKVSTEQTQDKPQKQASGGEESKAKASSSKHDRDLKKAERLAARQAQASKAEDEYKKDPNDPCADKFGDLPVIKSQGDPEKRYARKWTAVKDLDEKLKD